MITKDESCLCVSSSPFCDETHPFDLGVCKYFFFCLKHRYWNTRPAQITGMCTSSCLIPAFLYWQYDTVCTKLRLVGSFAINSKGRTLLTSGSENRDYESQLAVHKHITAAHSSMSNCEIASLCHPVFLSPWRTHRVRNILHSAVMCSSWQWHDPDSIHHDRSRLLTWHDIFSCSCTFRHSERHSK
jgi:hypothetical protein